MLLDDVAEPDPRVKHFAALSSASLQSDVPRILKILVSIYHINVQRIYPGQKLQVQWQFPNLQNLHTELGVHFQSILTA